MSSEQSGLHLCLSNSYPKAYADTQAHPLGSAQVLESIGSHSPLRMEARSDPDPVRTYTEECLATGLAIAISEAGVSVGL